MRTTDVSVPDHEDDDQRDIAYAQAFQELVLEAWEESPEARMLWAQRVELAYQQAADPTDRREVLTLAWKDPSMRASGPPRSNGQRKTLSTALPSVTQAVSAGATQSSAPGFLLG